MLGLMRENEAPGETMLSLRQNVLKNARRHLKILDPEYGDEELINSVAAELAK